MVDPAEGAFASQVFMAWLARPTQRVLNRGRKAVVQGGPGNSLRRRHFLLLVGQATMVYHK